MQNLEYLYKFQNYSFSKFPKSKTSIYKTGSSFSILGDGQLTRQTSHSI